VDQPFWVGWAGFADFAVLRWVQPTRDSELAGPDRMSNIQVEDAVVANSGLLVTVRTISTLRVSWGDPEVGPTDQKGKRVSECLRRCRVLPMGLVPVWLEDPSPRRYL